MAAANGAVDGQPGDSVSVVTFSTSSSQSSKSKRGPTGRGGRGNIRRNILPSTEAFEEDKMTSPSGWEIKTSRGVHTRTGRGGAGRVESTSKQRLEAARAFLQKEKEVLTQHRQEMRRHEKQSVGRGGAGNLQRKKNTIVPKESGFPGAQIGSKLFKTMTRSSRSSSERSVIDISRSDRDSDLWSIAESTMSRTTTAGIIISKFGESLVGKRQRPTANPPVDVVTGVCYSDASSPSPNSPSRQACNYDVTSPYRLARTPNEVAPFEEPEEPSPLAAVVFNATAASSASLSRQPLRAESSMSIRPALKRLIGGHEYPPAPRSATSSTFSYPSSYDDASSFDSRQSRYTSATPPMKEHHRQPGVPIPLRPPPPRVDTPSSGITNNFTLPVISTSASAALRMIARSTYDGDWFSDQTEVRSSGSSFYAEQHSGASTETESRNDHSAGKTHLGTPSRRASTGRYGTPSQYGPFSPSMLSVATAHSETSLPQFESFTPTFGVRKLPSLPAASLRSFDEFSLPSPPNTPLPGSTYSEDAYDSDSLTPAHPTPQPVF